MTPWTWLKIVKATVSGNCYHNTSTRKTFFKNMFCLNIYQSAHFKIAPKVKIIKIPNNHSLAKSVLVMLVLTYILWKMWHAFYLFIYLLCKISKSNLNDFFWKPCIQYHISNFVKKKKKKKDCHSSASGSTVNVLKFGTPKKERTP